MKSKIRRGICDHCKKDTEIRVLSVRGGKTHIFCDTLCQRNFFQGEKKNEDKTTIQPGAAAASGEGVLPGVRSFIGTVRQDGHIDIVRGKV